MIFENRTVTFFHTDDCGETYVKNVFSGAEVTNSEGISADNKGDNEKTSGIIRIPSKKGLEIFVGDYVYIGKTNDSRPDFSKVKKVVKVKESLKGILSLRHIKAEFI